MMKKKFIIFISVFMLLFLYLNISVMQVYEVESYPVEKAASFDDYIRTDYRDQINKTKPYVVIIGDSAIRELEQAVFSQVLGKKTLLFSAPGTGSAYWYLFMRHQVLEADDVPDFVFFFFRSVTLTTPSYLVTGSYYTRLEEIASPADADVYALTVESTKSPALKIPEKYIPLFAYRSEIYQNIVTSVRNWLPGTLLGCDDVCVDTAFDKVFDDYQINAFLWEELVRNLDSSLDKEGNYDFDANLENSLLPLMLKDARNAGITPVFIRTKYRSQARGQQDTPELLDYISKLEEYIQQNGGLFIDLAAVEELTADMYRDDIHLNLEDAPEASGIIAEEIQQVIGFLLQ